MRAALSFFSFLIVFSAILAAGAGLWAYHEYTRAGPLTEPALFVVESGQGVATISARLAADGIIAEPLLFRGAARLTGADKAIKAGEYRFEPGLSMVALLQKLEDGAVYRRVLTIPEGLTSWQIVQLLNDTEGLRGEITEIPPEGSLLPETYHYVWGDDRQAKLDRMRQAMKETLDQLVRDRPDGGPLLSEAEVVILASIVEKETSVAAERRRVAGVFVNRLEKGMKLQTDPTVIYALTEGRIQDEGQGPLGRRLLRKDLQFESPYNTYKYPGLPPGPIANPGRASLEAVLNPEEHEYYYFVADGTGGHAFGKTLEEHNRNVAQWRTIRRQQAAE